MERTEGVKRVSLWPRLLFVNLPLSAEMPVHYSIPMTHLTTGYILRLTLKLAQMHSQITKCVINIRGK